MDILIVGVRALVVKVGGRVRVVGEEIDQWLRKNQWAKKRILVMRMPKC